MLQVSDLEPKQIYLMGAYAAQKSLEGLELETHRNGVLVPLDWFTRAELFQSFRTLEQLDYA